MWQHSDKIDNCCKQNSAYISGQAVAMKIATAFFIFIFSKSYIQPRLLLVFATKASLYIYLKAHIYHIQHIITFNRYKHRKPSTHYGANTIRPLLLTNAALLNELLRVQKSETAAVS